MPYATDADMKGLIPQFTISATTKPNQTQADTIRNAVSGEIDGVLSAGGYAVPVTTPAYFLLDLALLNAHGAAAAVLRAMFPDSEGAIQETIEDFESRYKAGLQGLRDGSGIPAELGVSGSALKVSTYLTRNPDTEEKLGDIAEPLFKVGKAF